MSTILNVGVSVLNVRQQPNTTSPIRVQLHMGQSVDVIQDVDSVWSQITAQVGPDSISGYVSKQYLIAPDHSDVPGPTPIPIPVPVPVFSGFDITPSKMKILAPGAVDSILAGLAPAFSTFFPKYQINSSLRVQHFFSQSAEESDGFRTMFEYGGPSYFSRYDNRPDLGNTVPGDGYKYRGRGPFQLTGKYNYQKYATFTSLDLVNSPDLAADPHNGALIACEYWSRTGLNALADLDDIISITKRINGGLNGLSDRQTYLARAKKLW